VYFPDKKLEKEVAALAQRRTRSWALIGMTLDRVDRQKYWVRDARSFSEWLKSFALRIGMNESSLWRYLSASRYYQKLRKNLNLKGHSPSLVMLSEIVSAENLELLEKLERVVPKKEFEEVARRVLGGNVKRSELRRLWKTYRPVLTGRTARGKGVAAPRVDPKDREQLILQTAARGLTTLMSAGPEWTGIQNPEFYRTIREVILPKSVDLEPRLIYDPNKGLQYRAAFDMLAVVRQSVDSAVMLFGVQIFSLIENPSALGSIAKYCDRLWVALVGKEKIPDTVRLPKFVGILRVEVGGIKVEHKARNDYPGLGGNIGETLKELLPHLLRG
jgi:hypothetical protein